MQAGPRIAVVLVGDEDLFLDVMQRFPARKYPVIYASDLKDARQRCVLYEPQVLVLPLGETDQAELDELLKTARRHAIKIIGLGDPAKLTEELSELVDHVVDQHEVNAVLESVALALRERRSLPRANIELSLDISGIGEVQATVISGRSLFVPTQEPLKNGRMVQIVVDAGSNSLRCWARVMRVGEGASGQEGMVLGIGEREHAVRAYLDGLVRGTLLLERAEASATSAAIQLPDSLSQRLAERVEREVEALRSRLESQAALTEALNKRLEALAEAEARAVKWQDVRPVLVKKWSAQREVIKSIIERVNKIAADPESAAQLKKVFQAEAGLHKRLEEQRDELDSLRARIDALASSEQRQEQLRAARQAQERIEQSLSDQTALVSSLAEQLEMLGRQSHAQQPVMQETLEEHAAKIAYLGLKLDDLRDQLRLGQAEGPLQNLSSEVEQQGRELKQQGEQLPQQTPPPIPQRLEQLESLSEPLPLRPEASSPPKPDAPAPELETERLPGPRDSLDALPVGEWALMPELPQQDLSARCIPTNAEQGLDGDSPTVSRTCERVLADSAEAEAKAKATDHDEQREPRADKAEGLVETGDPETTNTALGSVTEGELSGIRVRAPKMPLWVYLVAPLVGLGLGFAAFLLVGGELPFSASSDDEAPAELTSLKPKATVAPQLSSTDEAPALVDAGAPDATVVRARTVTDSGPPVAASADAATTQDAAASRRQRPVRRLTALQRRRIYLRQGSLLMRRKKYRASQRYLTLALRIRDDHVVRWMLSRNHARAGELWPAVHHLKKAIAAAPRKVKPARHDALGMLYVKLGKKTAACQEIVAALRLRPAYTRAMKHHDQHCK